MLQARLKRGVSGIILGLNLSALAGFVIRDRNVFLALLLYPPLLPLGLAAFLDDLIHQGRAIQKLRFSLGIVGLISIGCSLFTMVGRGPATLSNPTDSAIKILHWNVYWGGWPETETGWTSIEETIVRSKPDIVVLSEVMPATRLDALQKRLGNGWSAIKRENGLANEGRFKFVVLSNRPVHEGEAVRVRNGAAMEARLVFPDRVVRLLVVDGVSKITQSRTPFLHDVAEVCRQAFESETPFDVVVGDFNAVGPSIRFDTLRETGEGYNLASESSQGWRGTWPLPLPVYDIDHLWIRDGWRILSCSIFQDRRSDHRGEMVRLMPPAPRRNNAENVLSGFGFNQETSVGGR